MIALAVAPFLIGLLLLGFAERLGNRLKPSLAVPLLTVLSLTVALSSGLVLSAAAALACAQLGPLPRLGQWSAPALRARMGFPETIGIVALVVVGYCLAAAAVRAIASARSLHTAHRAVQLLHPVAGDLVLVEDETPIAYSVAAVSGRIVISSAMLNALSPAERRVLLAHEAAHLRHRHHLYLHLVRLAAAANPLLRTTADVVARSVERWADEDAAAEVGDRSLVAHALARAALAGARKPSAVPALAAADSGVVARVQLLLAPARPQARTPIVLVTAAMVVSWATAVAISLWAVNLIQLAETAYVHS